MSKEVLATIEASAGRRVMGTLMLGVTGCLLVYVAFAAPPSPAWLVFLLAVGAGALWLAVRMWQATVHRIELTAEELRSSDGQVIVRVEDIEAIDRGFFAFKPSNGFLIRSSVPGGRAWMPGLWWRSGRRIGIGGVTPGSQGKAMSEILAAMLMQRGQG
ncbi:hypothetical protein KUV26_07275 [Leisingera daeponensis]|uniref:DUF2244 domain-containing protein n=1 Tax=Leisingera daeponensis TaxID=405746 RepID=A0ABS7NDG7_9RHOB|nr:hypothetical protein [Leisingera daeponensis]MBY6056677.1 hypothetical protein [Leisingera daeponensis]MBY6139238.1 hypothetical protein [Leisingera daeponensis]